MPIKNSKTALKSSQKDRDDYIPSWSWASVIGTRVLNVFEVEQHWPLLGLDETAQILNVRITPKTPDVFGQIA